MTGLAAVMRKEDAARYEAAGEVARAALDSLFWDVADPLSLTAVNEARIEFLSRVAYADLRFTSAEFNRQGWNTDRGVIILRYGEPPVVATFAPEVDEVDASDALGRVTTVWYYPATKMRFVFAGPPAMNSAYFAGNFRSYADNARHVAPMRFDNLEAARIDSVPVQVARFRADTGRGTDVAIYADIPTRQMLRDVDLTQAQLETGLFVTNAARDRVVAARDSSVVRVNARDRFTTRSWARPLRAGDFLYRVEAREPASGRAARGLASFSVERFPAGTFTLSDVLVARGLAPKTDGTPRGRADFLITPNASMTYAPQDTVFLYWENYGTARDSAGNGRLRVELGLRLTAIDRGRRIEARILGGIADAVGLTAEGDDRVSLRYERTVALDAADRVPNHLALGLGDAPYGTYKLELTVTDLTNGKVAKRERTIIVPRP
jgi:GWxTD domain-containing protein